MRWRRLVVITAGLALAAGHYAAASGQSGRGPAPKASVAPFVVFGGPDLIPNTGSALVRTKAGVFATIHTQGLEPGTVVTAWFTIFNNPRHCATRPCGVPDLANPAVDASVLSAGGRIVSADGAATFGAFRAVGDASGAGGPPTTPNLGLSKPFSSEIHLVTRTHGPALLDDPEALAQQLSTFGGGCATNSCANLQASVHVP